ncbi:MAG: peptide chain release factor 1 [Bacilli bacterium]|nr:peptide chain release factor 1 [Bacilli bacterium]MBQ8901696.1 peptide chain release factor 1 [Bacilli bacterium]
MFERLENILKKSEELKLELTKPEVLNDYNKLKELSKEQSDLEETVNVYNEYKETEKALEEAKSLINDEEFREIALVEVENLSQKIESLHKELEILLVPKDENDGKNVIMEIRGAAGGDEANIFAGDLFRMYSYYAEEMGWKIEVLNSIEGTSGGFSQIECMIKGTNVYSKLKYESGSHRVQRVPATETQGRVHTSTATVLVMPEVEDVDIEIKESDLKIDVFHSSGAGGQSVNTANSAVRITHVPTGVVVGCQTERSQLRNKENAMRLLRIKLHDEMKQKQEQEVGATRKTKIGTGDRSEKIRTYNYPQNRVTDHRINFSLMELDRVMDGNLAPIVEALITEDMRLKLAGENFNS